MGAVDPPAGIQSDGLTVSVLVKIRIDRAPLPGFVTVIEVLTVFAP
jgi:hypothetical protein